MSERLRSLKRHFGDNRGDVYIETLIATVVLLLVCLLISSVATAISGKMWLDGELNDLCDAVALSGCVKGSAVTEIEQRIVSETGGTVTYEADFLNSSGCVQLNGPVRIRFHMDRLVVFSVMGIEVASPVDLEKTAVSSVYFKVPSNTD